MYYVMKSKKILYFFNYYIYSDYILFEKDWAEEICFLLNNPDILQKKIHSVLLRKNKSDEYFYIRCVSITSGKISL